MATLTIQPDAAAGKDAYFSVSSPSANYGTGATLYVGDNTGNQRWRSLLALGVAGVPAGALITSATLSLWESYAARADPGPASWAVELRRVLLNWVEAEVTWTKYSTAGGNWATAGCSNASDRDDAVLASVALDGTAANGFVSWSGAGLTAFCQGILDGTITDYGLLLSAPTAEALGAPAAAGNGFLTSDYTVDAAKRPKLVLEYYTGAFALRTDHYNRMRQG